MRLHATGFEREVLVDCHRVTGLIAGLVDDQWRRIKSYEDARPRGTGIHTGRPRAMARECYEGVLWVMLGGGEWRKMPKHLPGHVTVWRRLVEWREAGVWFDHVWRAVRPLASPEGAARDDAASKAAVTQGTVKPATKKRYARAMKTSDVKLEVGRCYVRDGWGLLRRLTRIQTFAGTAALWEEHQLASGKRTGNMGSCAARRLAAWADREATPEEAARLPPLPTLPPELERRLPRGV